MKWSAFTLIFRLTVIIERIALNVDTFIFINVFNYSEFLSGFFNIDAVFNRAQGNCTKGKLWSFSDWKHSEINFPETQLTCECIELLLLQSYKFLFSPK